MLIFEHNSPGRSTTSLYPATRPEINDIPKNLLRKTRPVLPEVSEMQVVRHYTSLSQKNFSIDTHFLSARFLHHEI
ncbi:glycine dehydrogenase subunit 2 [Beggiatoa sp. PS]|nr:glycine dehydrogenase subunit 2 [Beggiatoa sp. PS]